MWKIWKTESCLPGGKEGADTVESVMKCWPIMNTSKNCTSYIERFQFSYKVANNLRHI